jgi:hypothetical protein
LVVVVVVLVSVVPLVGAVLFRSELVAIDDMLLVSVVVVVVSAVALVAFVAFLLQPAKRMLAPAMAAAVARVKPMARVFISLSLPSAAQASDGA